MSKVKYKQQKRRFEIIETVLPLIEKNHFDELSVAEICEVADISVGSFYHYFNSKSDILVGLLALIDQYMEAEVFPMLTAENEIQNLKNYAHYWACYVAEHGLERSKLISSIGPSDIDLSGNKRISIVKLESIILAGQEKKQIRGDIAASELTEMFLLALRGVTVDWSRVNGTYSVVEKMENYISIFVQALRI